MENKTYAVTVLRELAIGLEPNSEGLGLRHIWHGEKKQYESRYR
jgi:hypothetical protein